MKNFDAREPQWQEPLLTLEESSDPVAQMNAIMRSLLSRIPLPGNHNRHESEHIGHLEKTVHYYKDDFLNHIANVVGVTVGSEPHTWNSFAYMTLSRTESINHALQSRYYRAHKLAFINLALGGRKHSLPRVAYDLTSSNGQMAVWRRYMSDGEAPHDKRGKLVYAAERLLEDHISMELSLFGLEFTPPADTAVLPHPNHIFLNSHLERKAV